MKTLHLLRLPLLLVLAGAFALAGAIISTYRSHYQASFGLPLGSMLEFKNAEPLLRSASALSNFARAHGLAGSPEFERFEAQLATGGTSPVQVEQQQAFTRAGMREVPEPMASNMLKNQSPVTSVHVSAMGRTPETATKTADLAMNFVRAVLIRRALVTTVSEWQNFGSKIQAYDLAILAKQSEIASLDRSITAMSQLDSGQKSESAPAALASPFQVQVNGSESLPATAFLPPAQQIVGLKSKRITLSEELKRTQDDLSESKTLYALGQELAPMKADEQDPFKALDAALARAQKLRAEAPSVPEQKAADSMLVRLMSIKEHFVDLQTVPTGPAVHWVGFGPMMTAAAGAVVGVLAWLGILYWLIFGPALQLESSDDVKEIGPKEAPGAARFSGRPARQT